MIRANRNKTLSAVGSLTWRNFVNPSRHSAGLNSKGLIDQFILNQIDGKRTWDEIAELVRSAFPDQFIQPEDVFKLFTSLTGLIDTHDQ
jgi:hypothetical protein